MSQIRIVTDSSADLPPGLADELGITLVPLMVTFGDRSYEDTTLSPDAFWRLVAETGVSPKTSQPPQGLFESAFARLVEAGHQVLCLTITQAHSGTYATAWSAASAFGDHVSLFDSQSLSLGLGYQVMRAARMAREGLPMTDILARLRSLRDRVHLMIQLDTTDFLRRGGRAARLMPVIDRFVRALNIKPQLGFVEGELKLLGVVRSRSKGMQRIAEQIGRLGPLEFLAVMHIRCHEAALELADALARLTGTPREQIWLGEAGAVLASHGGAGTVAAMAVTREEGGATTE